MAFLAAVEAPFELADQWIGLTLRSKWSSLPTRRPAVVLRTTWWSRRRSTGRAARAARRSIRLKAGDHLLRFEKLGGELLTPLPDRLVAYPVEEGTQLKMFHLRAAVDLRAGDVRYSPDKHRLCMCCIDPAAIFVE